jgi:hypothetical protein
MKRLMSERLFGPTKTPIATPAIHSDVFVDAAIARAIARMRPTSDRMIVRLPPM